MVRHRPHPALRGQLRRVTGFIEHAEAPVYRRELPGTGVTLIFGLDSEIRIGSRRGEGTYGSFVAGLHEIPVDTEHPGVYRCVQVDLSPLGGYQLFGVPMCELTDTVVGLEVLGRPGWRQLGDRLAETPGWDQRFQLLERTLGRWLAAGPAADPAVHWAWQRLARSHGAVPVGQLSAEIGWSRRHFASQFARQIGLAPKAAAQVLRFSHALELLTEPGAGTISAVAAEAGYADHSHLVREFRRLAEATPSELLASHGRAAA